MYSFPIANFHFLQVTLPDFFLADHLTSQVPDFFLFNRQRTKFNELSELILGVTSLLTQVQAMRSFEFYTCYYGWGAVSQGQSKCHSLDVYNVFYFIVAIVPYWIRFLQVFLLFTFMIFIQFNLWKE